MSYNKRLQELIEQYRNEVGGSGPVQIADIAGWLLQQRLWAPSMQDAVALLSRDLGNAMRTQFITDEKGRRIRRKHAIRIKDTAEDGKKVQLVFWHDIDTAPPNFMQQSLQQRREAIADACWQLKQDADYYNEHFNNGPTIQLIFDFYEDLEERAASDPFEEGDEEAFD